MARVIAAVLLSMVASVYTINRPVYKIVLTQKGFAQFLQYDVVTPPLTEFTFCSWIRVYDLSKDQTIFTYVANGNNRIIRLWLDSGGQHMKISINGRMASTVPVEVVKDVWRHVCLSYQSDYGAWALYIDSKLFSCEAARNLHGFVMPGGGSVIIGYGIVDNGASNGFEGEIFGANMILTSTIERNFTIKGDPLYEQKRFPRNKIKDESKSKNYVVLSDFLNAAIHNNFEKSNKHQESSLRKHEILEIPIHEETTKVTQITTTASSKEDLDYVVSDFSETGKEKLDYWNNKGNPKFTFDEVYNEQTPKPFATKLSKSATRVVPAVTDYEVPPTPFSQNFYYQKTQDKQQKRKPSFSSYWNNSTGGYETKSDNKYTDLTDIDSPPPIDLNNKVYGQWTSSRFAGTVLNYLKSINYKNREPFIKRIPQTIPLLKLSDSHPYQSEFKLNILRPPPAQFINRKVVEKRYDIIRREPQVNVNSLEDDMRLNILKNHFPTLPQKENINNRGTSLSRMKRRVYRDTEDKTISKEEINDTDENQPKLFSLEKSRHKNHRYYAQLTPNHPRKTRFSFSRSIEYTTENPEYFEPQIHDDVHKTNSKRLSNGNKWHNAKSYNNDYTPHKLGMHVSETNEHQKVIYPSLKLKYDHTRYNTKDSTEIESSMLRARKLATAVSNQSLVPGETISILKYNDGVLPSYEELMQIKSKNDNVSSYNRDQSKRNMKVTHLDQYNTGHEQRASNFDQTVKIGNALNEHIVIGIDEQDKKRSFLGGDDNIPDINKYRSDLDNENTKVPPSLGPRECKNVDFSDRVLYIQQDESIDLTHILSPLREKNLAIEFVLQNYKKCSLTDSSFQKNVMLLIDWNKTPVRLFGGAYPKTTTDLCGFF